MKQPGKMLRRSAYGTARSSAFLGVFVVIYQSTPLSPSLQPLKPNLAPPSLLLHEAQPQPLPPPQTPSPRRPPSAHLPCILLARRCPLGPFAPSRRETQERRACYVRSSERAGERVGCDEAAGVGADCSWRREFVVRGWDEYGYGEFVSSDAFMKVG
jgi:hypothetical protein